jgi:thioredoxin-related protein
MKSWKARIIFIFLPLLTIACNSSSDQAASMLDAKALAFDNGKKILVLVSTKGCPTCERFKIEMKENSRIREAIKSVVFYEADVATTDGKRLSQIHNIRTYPTFLLLDDDETLIGSWFGFYKAGEWAKNFKASLAKSPRSGETARNG